MTKYRFLILFMIASLAIACSNESPDIHREKEESPSLTTNKVLLSSEIIWEQLNPARGDKSPAASTIWGDRKGTLATGFLAKFVDGFSSPPHIHNVTYRAMVIKGLVHNDDPAAQEMWMSPGSFWTQPAGESHITSAKGEEVIAYVEIDSGPYLVKPIEEAFDNGERPVNVDKNNIVWLDASRTSVIESSNSSGNPELAFLWKSKSMTGNLIKLPAGFKGKIISEGEEFHAIVITGEFSYIMPSTAEVKNLDPGSYFTSTGKSIHELHCDQTGESTIYIRTNGKFSIR